MSDPSGFDRLADLALRRDAELRPTLLRVLTDLYVQRLAHSREDEQRFTELALPLLETVDPATRAEIARRLKRHLSPPARVMAFLAGGANDITAPKQPEPLVSVATTRQGEDSADAGAASLIGDEALAADLDQQFFAADAEARRLILRNVPVVAPDAGGEVARRADAATAERLEAAVLTRNLEEFARLLASSLRISLDQAHRIARDDLGEPLVVAARALGIKRDALYRMLMFINPAIGHSVERVHALAALYDEISVRSADDIVAIWRAVSEARSANARSRSGYQPVTWNDVRRRARIEPASLRSPAGPSGKDRRSAS